MKIIRFFVAMLLFCLLTIPVSAQISTAPETTQAVIEETPVFQLDNSHIYENMQQSYSEGYEPDSNGTYAVVVLPILCESEYRPPSVRVSVSLDADSSAFTVRNYEQTVPLSLHTASDGSQQEIYLATFWLLLSPNRVNGCYPVTLHVGEAMSYTVYVNITDGIDPNATDHHPVETYPPEEPIVFEPKLLVDRISGGTFNAGESSELHITLKNTSHTEALQNLTVTAAVPDYFSLDAATDTLYFETIDADSEFEAVFRCSASPDTPAGSYSLPLQFDFSYGKGMKGGGSAVVHLTIGQPVKMEFPTVAVPFEAVVSDRFSITIQAINLGVTAATNVRATLTGDGLLPENTAFIGEVAGGTSAEAVLNVMVTAKRGDEPYGDTNGQITYFYTDEAGVEHTQTQDFTMTLKSPFSGRAPIAEQTDSRAWLLVMSGIGVGILCLIAVLLLRRKRG